MVVNSSRHSPANSCDYPETTYIMSFVSVFYILTVPLLLFVLVVGCQRWRNQPLSPASATWSHIDIFTYNVVVLDLLGISGTYFIYFAFDQPDLLAVGNGMSGLFLTGHQLFHLLTCVERYLAVVHPISYLRLRGSAGVRARNVSIGGVWLISAGVVTLALWLKVSFVTLSLVCMAFTVVAFCFCSLSVLCALIRPAPGEGGGNKKLSNQSKRRALLPMIIITGALSLRFLSSLIVSTIQILCVPFSYVFCVVGCSSMVFLVPSSLVLPLLFLQRVGKLKVCGHKADALA